jgi:hypothetical protein
MKTLVVRLIIAALLLAGGEAFRRAALIETRLADSQQRLTIATASVTPASVDDVEASLGAAAQIPVIGDALRRDVRRQRALAAYWNADYASVAARAAASAGEETGDEPDDPTLRFLEANAAFRNTLRTRRDRAGVLRGLDDALKLYGDVLRADPSHTGAAYNYEFVGRLRTAIGRGQRTDNLAPEGPPQMHGEEGNPPEGTKPPEFNVIVPMRPEERQEQFEAGEGGVTRRRG